MEDSMSLHSEEPDRGSAALAPIITQQMTVHHTERCYTTVRGKMNTPLLLLTHSATDLTNDVTDPRQPADRSGDRKELFLSALALLQE